MSKFTDFLNLFKWEPDIDGEEEFNIDKALNENWDKIDTKLKTYITDTDEKIDNFEADVNDSINEIKDVVDGGVGDLVVNYKNSTITAPTIQGFGKIHKLYGKTEEVGSGEKSPDNPYEISCVGSPAKLSREDLEVGSINAETGALISTSIALRTKNLISLEAGTYEITHSSRI